MFGIFFLLVSLVVLIFLLCATAGEGKLLSSNRDGKGQTGEVCVIINALMWMVSLRYSEIQKLEVSMCKKRFLKVKNQGYSLLHLHMSTNGHLFQSLCC